MASFDFALAVGEDKREKSRLQVPLLCSASDVTLAGELDEVTLSSSPWSCRTSFEQASGLDLTAAKSRVCIRSGANYPLSKCSYSQLKRWLFYRLLSLVSKDLTACQFKLAKLKWTWLVCLFFLNRSDFDGSMRSISHLCKNLCSHLIPHRCGIEKVGAFSFGSWHSDKLAYVGWLSVISHVCSCS